jgi:hypothetical protein
MPEVVESRLESSIPPADWFTRECLSSGIDPAEFDKIQDIAEPPKNGYARRLWDRGYEPEAYAAQRCGWTFKFGLDRFLHRWRSHVYTCHDRFCLHCGGTMDRKMFDEYEHLFQFVAQESDDRLRSMFYFEMETRADIEPDAIDKFMSDVARTLRSALGDDAKAGAHYHVIPRGSHKLVAKIIAWGDTDFRRELTHSGNLRSYPIQSYSKFSQELHKLCDSELVQDDPVQRADNEIAFWGVRMYHTLGSFYDSKSRTVPIPTSPPVPPSEADPNLFPIDSKAQGNNLAHSHGNKSDRRHFCPDCGSPIVAVSEWLPVDATEEQIRNAKYYPVTPPRAPKPS